jgi:uncharacterized membrane-anchored protein YhcB (DUF1043 family)
MDLFPKTLGSWIFMIVACLVGLFIGQWIRRRRSKAGAEHEALVQMAKAQQKRRLSKKERRKYSKGSLLR